MFSIRTFFFFGSIFQNPILNVFWTYVLSFCSFLDTREKNNKSNNVTSFLSVILHSCMYNSYSVLFFFFYPIDVSVIWRLKNANNKVSGHLYGGSLFTRGVKTLRCRGNGETRPENKYLTAERFVARFVFPRKYTLFSRRVRPYGNYLLDGKQIENLSITLSTFSSLFVDKVLLLYKAFRKAFVLPPIVFLHYTSRLLVKVISFIG